MNIRLANEHWARIFTLDCNEKGYANSRLAFVAAVMRRSAVSRGKRSRPTMCRY